MNRLIKKTVSNVSVLKIPSKSFCSEVLKVSGSTSLETSNEHEKRQTISKNIPEYDIAIVGGGMVGMSLACFLASMPMTKQLSVAIIDSNPAWAVACALRRKTPLILESVQ